MYDHVPLMNEIERLRAELEYEYQANGKWVRLERDMLQARLAAVIALCDELEGNRPWFTPAEVRAAAMGDTH